MLGSVRIPVLPMSLHRTRPRGSKALSHNWSEKQIWCCLQGFLLPWCKAGLLGRQSS